MHDQTRRQSTEWVCKEARWLPLPQSEFHKHQNKTENTGCGCQHENDTVLSVECKCAQVNGDWVLGLFLWLILAW